MGIERKYKDPNEKITFGVDWSEYLGVATISSSSWIVPAGITQLSSANTTTKATVMLSGGTLGDIYRITNRINTSAGEMLDQSIDIEVIEK
jgi:hypothetical protein